MARVKNPQITLHEDPDRALERLKTALAGEGTVPDVSRQFIVNALVLYTPPEQAAGMVAAYSRHLHKLAAEAREVPNDG